MDWVKLQIGEALEEAAAGMTVDQVGALHLVVCLMARRRGLLIDDASFIAGQLRMSRQRWTAMRKRLLARGDLVVVVEGEDRYLDIGPARPAQRDAMLDLARSAGRRVPLRGRFSPQD